MAQQPDSIKIAVIGGGSSYTPELIEGFIKRHQELPVREIWLVDVEEGRNKLEIVGQLAKRMVEKAGVPIEIQLTLDRKKALKGADFVTTQFRVGLLAARAKDERIPLKYGVLGQETNGPGGFSRPSEPFQSLWRSAVKWKSCVQMHGSSILPIQQG